MITGYKAGAQEKIPQRALGFTAPPWNDFFFFSFARLHLRLRF